MGTVNNNKEPKFIVWGSFHSILSFLNFCRLQRRGSDSPSPGGCTILNICHLMNNKKCLPFLTEFQRAQYLVATQGAYMYMVKRINLPIKR